MKCLCLACVLLSVTKIGHAQILNIDIIVKVQNTEGEVLTGATVLLYTADSQEPQPCFTDEFGGCSFRSILKLDSIAATYVGYSPTVLRKRETNFASGDTIVLTLSELSVDLVGAVVTGKYSGIIVKGDTIRFDVDHLTDGRELDLAEVVDKLPGLSANADGSLTYNGETVDRVIIDNQDLVRSQFSMLNDILLPNDVEEIDLIEKHDAETAQTSTILNIKTKSRAPLRYDAIAGTSLRAEPYGKFTLLRTQPDGWQGYLTLRSSNHGEPTQSGADAARGLNSDFFSLSDNVEYQPSTIGTSEDLGATDATVSQRNDHLGQLNIVRSAGKRDFAAYVTHRRQRARSTGQLFSLAFPSADTITSLDLANRLSDSRTDVSLSISDSTNSKIKGVIFAGGSYRPYGLSNQATVFDISGMEGNLTNEEENTDRQVYVAGQAQFKVDKRSRIDVYGRTQTSAYDYNQGFVDQEIPFNAISVQEAGEEPFDLAWDTRRRHTLRVADARFQHRFNKTYKLAVAVQLREDRWKENTIISPGDSDFEIAVPKQKENLRLLQLQASRRQSNKKQSLTILMNGGLGQLQYDRGQNIFTESDVFPHGNLTITYFPISMLRLYLVGSSQVFNVLNTNEYWQQAIPHGNRTLIEGIEITQPFTRSNAVAFATRYVNAVSGTTGLATFSYNQTDLSLRRITRADSSTTFVLLRPELLQEAQRLAASTFLSARLGPKWTTSMSTNWTSYKGLTVTDQEYSSSLALLRGSIHWGGNTPFSISLNGQTTQQFIRLETSGGSRISNVPFSSGRVGTKLRWRSYKFTIEAFGSALFSEQTTLVPIAGFRAVYKSPKLPLEISLRGEDLLNYRSSTFTTLQGSEGQLDYFRYERLPGFVLATLKYTWKSGNKEADVGSAGGL